MARIAGVNIPTQKKLGVALTYVYGIGDKISKDVCSQANVDANTRVQDLSEAEIKNVSDVISSSFLKFSNSFGLVFEVQECRYDTSSILLQ